MVLGLFQSSICNQMNGITFHYFMFGWGEKLLMIQRQFYCIRSENIFNGFDLLDVSNTVLWCSTVFSTHPIELFIFVVPNSTTKQMNNE